MGEGVVLRLQVDLRRPVLEEGQGVGVRRGLKVALVVSAACVRCAHSSRGHDDMA